MSESYSVGDARARLPKLLDDVEQGRSVELTRRGKPVAWLIPVREYRRLVGGRKGLWSTILEFREQTDLSDLDVDEIFRDVRDRSLGRYVNL